MASHPLITIAFESLAPESYGHRTVRHWYHVPRTGDDVELRTGIVDRDGNTVVDGYIGGSVKVVMWSDDCEATVRLR